MAANRPRPRELYRDPAHGKIAGICAGIARYFDWPVWPVRLVVVLLAVFTQFFPLLAAYLIAWFILDPISHYSPPGLRGQVDGWVMHTRSRWEQGNATGATINPEPEPEAAYRAPEPERQMPETPVFDTPRNRQAPIHTPVLADAISVEAAFAELEQRVQVLERHVTEPAFVLRQQFRTL